MKLNRRDFIKLTAAGVGLAAFPGCATVSGGKSKGARVVVIGGGFGGATAAKYLRMWSQGAVDVTMVERNKQFVSCPMSNTVLSGLRNIGDLTKEYQGLKNKHGVNVINDEVVGIDSQKQTVTLSKGQLHYDRLVVAPGVDFIWDEIEGLNAQVSESDIPHAWKAGNQTITLRKQLESMQDGGVFAISVPKMPYRCPPGPYERACQVAHYLKQHKPRSKVILLDANADIVSKKGLFRAAWNDLYPGMIEYHADASVKKVNAPGRVATTEFEDVKADVLNVIPPMRAGAVAKMAGVVDDGGRWCPVDFLSYESTLQKNIHVIGDSVSAALPKSGHMATSQAKICAAAIIDMLGGTQPDIDPAIANTCYSMVSTSEAMHVANVYRFDKEKKIMVSAPGGGVSEKRSEIEGTLAGYWLENILNDVLA